MKAILIKYLSATDTKSVRLKACAEGVKAITVPRANYDLSLESDALLLADMAAQKWFGDLIVVDGFGTLPDGNFVATLMKIPELKIPPPLSEDVPVFTSEDVPVFIGNKMI